MARPQQVPLGQIVVDAQTQVRAQINSKVVDEYAALMKDGVTFPAVVLFHDGNRYYMADGFHRLLALKRNGAGFIAAHVHPGASTDALWYALGANREHGARLTAEDKKHAILLALDAFYLGREVAVKSAAEIAQQVGCDFRYVDRIIDAHRAQDGTSPILPSRVIGKDGKNYPATRTPAADPAPPPSDDAPFKSQEAVARRRQVMRDLAANGHTSQQIAEAVGLGLESCRKHLRAMGVEVRGDQVIGRVHRHNADRIVETMVMDAANLTADVSLIRFAELTPARMREWIDSLRSSQRKLTTFIRRLSEEHARVQEREED